MALTYLFLDANFILISPQFKVDIYSEFERLLPKPWQIVIVSAILNELEHKISQFPEKFKLKREYSMARQLLDRQSYLLLPKERSPNQLVDDLLLETAIEYRANGHPVYLCTNDKELRDKCLKHEVANIFLRQQKFLDLG